jgi:HEAT repeat protein
MIDCDGLEKVKTARSNGVLPATIDSLIADLGSRDGLVRQRARITLIHMGEPAVPSLIKAFETRRNFTHWEAAKALSRIGDLRSVQALVQALEDNEFGVRWLAAEGLIAVGYCSLVPLLQALIDRPESVRLREGIHHVLHDLVSQDLLDPTAREQVKPILAALNDVEPAVAVPIAAHQALKALKKKDKRKPIVGQTGSFR